MAETPNVVMNDETRRFEIRQGGDVAFAEYRLVDDHITLPHTVVPDSMGGKGIGSALAEAALTYARDNGLTVIPTCTFMAGYITRHPEWHDLVDPGYRSRLGLS